jgi:hypothetical protein
MDAPTVVLRQQDIENLWQWASVLGNNTIILSIRRGNVHARTEGNETEIEKYGLAWNVPHERKARYSAAQFAAAVDQVRNSGEIQISMGMNGHLYLRHRPDVVLAPLAEPSRTRDAT